MKRYGAAAICFILLILFLLPGCQGKSDKLTLEAIRSIAAEKGEALTWSDFEQYPSVETGSGLYILVYDIDEEYKLMIGGMPDEAPIYIYLVSANDFDRRIDIRYDDIDSFLEKQSEG